MSESNHNTSDTDKTDGANPRATLLEQATWSFSGTFPVEDTPMSARGSSLPIPTRGDTQKQQDAPRSSAPPDFEMEVDGQERENQQDFQTRSQPPSRDQSEESLVSELRNEVELAEANGHPASQSSQHSNPRSGATQVDQLNGTRDNQRDATPGHRTPPSGQGSTAVEEAPIDPKELLEPYEWDDLEERFLKKMEECQVREEGIEKEFREWIQILSHLLQALTIQLTATPGLPSMGFNGPRTRRAASAQTVRHPSSLSTLIDKSSTNTLLYKAANAHGMGPEFRAQS
ncbi:MAG: hypothetical protein Q9208_005991 [Pyrenodesmia sp. 3 TL-2023]